MSDWRLSRGVKPDACKSCPAYARGNGFVPGDGPFDSAIALVGRGPGASEGLTGRPYSGGGGRLLDQIISRAGLRRSDCYVTNVVKCFLPTDPTKAEISYCSKTYLAEELVGRKVIGTLGAVPGALLAGVDKVKRERGTIRRFKDTPVVVTLEPAGLIWSKSEGRNKGEQRDYLPIVIKDFVKIKRIATDTAEVSATREMIPRPTDDQVRVALDMLMQVPKFALDVETDRSSGVVTRIGLSHTPGKAICIRDWRRWKPELDKLFSREEATMIIHNVQFDSARLEESGFTVKNRFYDTMLADHLIESDMGNFGLEACVSRHLDYEPWKHLKSSDEDLYNCLDTAADHELEERLTPLMVENGVDKLFWKHQMPMSFICRDMQREGLRVDVEAMMRYKIGCQRLMARYDAALTTALGPLFNWRSPKQVSWLLYEKMGLPVQLHRRTKKPTTDHYALDDLLKLRPESKILESIIELKKLGKLDGTFLSGTYIDNGQLRPNFLQHRTVTGRLASSEPNIQQIPKGLARSCIIADHDDWIFIEADFSQIELRLAAWFAGCQKMIDRFREFDEGRTKWDLHSQNAQRFYGTINIDLTQRSLAKNMIYGILYGQGASGLGTMYGVREDYAKTYINFIFNEYPELRTWRMGLLNAIDERNYLRNPYGRIRWLWNRMFATEAFICLPQGCAADVIYESMIELKQRLPKPARMAMQVHDSILIACPASMRDEVSTLQKEIMTKPREALRGYHIPIKQGAGRSYEEATHEEGLHGDWRRLRRVVR